MKKISFLFFLIPAILGAVNIYGQKVRLIEGTLPVFSKNKLVNVEFSYDNMRIGSFSNEQEYMDRNIEEFNKKEAGRGDKWAENWKNDKKEKHEPAFMVSFSESGFILDDKAPYTIIFHTVFTEPGFHAGPVKRSAYINAEAYIVNTDDKSKILAKVAITEARGKASIGSGYDTGGRIAKCYTSAAKALAGFLAKGK
ncbi:MAG: hypothetical protein KF862_05455 [Chitinophagaceae bacterium]|nr:hypothetical protein [Chitinophagaceae bacterium]